MARYTCNIEVKKEGTTSKNKPRRFQVRIRVYDSMTRKMKRIPTGIWLTSTESWNRRKQKIKAHAEDGHAEEWNEIIQGKLKEVRKNCRRLETGVPIQPTEDSCKQDYSFLNFVRCMRDDIVNAGRINYGKRFNTLVQKIKMFLKAKRKTDLLFSEVNYEFCQRFQVFLQKLPKQNNKNELLSQSAVAEILTMLKTSVREAVNLKKIMPQDNPFLHFKYSHGVVKQKERLSFDEIKKLEALEFDDTEHGRLLLLSRDAFLFSFYAAGMRFEDVCMLRWMNVKVEGESVRLTYTMHKNGKNCDWVLVPEALAILKRWYGDKHCQQNDYIFPLLDTNADYAKANTYEKITVMAPPLKKKLFMAISSRNVVVNRSLKELTKLAGIYKSISFHCARHSVASIAVSEGVGLERVRGILKHTNYSTTQRYVADFNNSTNDETLRAIFNSNKERIPKSSQVILHQIAELPEEERAKLLSELRKLYS